MCSAPPRQRCCASQLPRVAKFSGGMLLVNLRLLECTNERRSCLLDELTDEAAGAVGASNI